MYPLLFPFQDSERFKSYIEYALKFDGAALEASTNLLKKNLIPLASGHELSYYLGISKSLVPSICHAPQRYYNTFQIPKKSGGSRSITAPRVFLKVIQRYIADCIFKPLPVHDCVHGFEQSRGTATGATIHLGSRYVWNIDLENFFPSIPKLKVKQLLLNVGYPEKAAYTVATLCTLDGKLPQGAPSSPVISNRIFFEIDQRIASTARDYSIKYSRYADDLTFSSNDLIPVAFRDSIKNLINENGFRLNPSKIRLIGPAQRREVTGLVINDQISIPREKRRQLRAQFHQASLHPQDFADKKNELIGYASWVFSHHHSEGRKYLHIAKNIPNLEDGK